MAAVIARVTGTALAPGVSRNGRLYTKEAIGKAVARGQAQIADGKRPITMKSHHMAGDDSLRVVGSVSKLWQDPDTGAAMYEGTIADTPAGQTIKSLTDDSDGKPAHLKGVSIRGAWMAEPRQQQYEGQSVDTADDLAIYGLDYTADPGVDAADVHHLPASGDEAADAPAYSITESAPEATVTASPTLAVLIAESGLTLNQMHTELGIAPLPGEAGSLPAALEAIQAVIGEAAKPLKSGKPAAAPTKANSYADPGYQPDKAPRYALDTKKQAKAAWAYINQADNAKNYTANQLKRIKGRVIKALKKFGVAVTAEHYLVDPAQELTESTTLAECMGDCYSDPATAGSFYVSLTNGPVTVTVSSYTVDPADLDLIGRAAMDGACTCLATIDPDMDGDMDVPGASAEDTDHDMPEDGADANVPGTACPCGCKCAIPVDPDAANCPCTCDDCDVCGSSPANAPTGEAVGPQPTPVYPEQDPPITVESTEPPAPIPAADHTETEAPAMSEPTTAVEPTQAAAPIPAPAVTLSAEQFQQLLAAASRPVEAAPAPVAPVAEAAPTPVAAPVAPAPVAPAPVAESQEQMIARLVAEGIAAGQTALIQTLAESGALGGRKGLTAQSPAATNAGQVAGPVAEGVNSYGMPAGAPDKPLHLYTTEELNRWAGPMVFEHAVGHYATRRA